jgi:hypothetical protein
MKNGGVMDLLLSCSSPLVLNIKSDGTDGRKHGKPRSPTSD